MNTQSELLKSFASKVKEHELGEQATPQEEPQEVQNEQVEQQEPVQTELEFESNAEETEIPTEEAPKEEVKDEPKEEVKTESEDNDFESNNDWLEEESKEEVQEPVAQGNFEVYSDIAEALGVESFGDKDSVINHLKEMKETTANLEKELALAKEETPFANDDIKTANELAKGGGDFKTYLELASVDYNSIDDDTLLLELVGKPTLGDNPEQLKEWLDGLTPTQKQFESNRIRQNLVAQDNAKKQEIIEIARKNKEYIDNGVKDVLKTSDNLFGLKMTPSMKKKTFENITSEKGLFSHILDKEGKLDHKKAVEADFILSNFKEIVKNALTNERNKMKAEEFKETSKPNMNTQKGSKDAPVKKKGDIQVDALNALRNRTYRGK